MTGLMDRRLVVRLRSLAVERKRAGRGSFAPGDPGSAKEPRMRGPGRAWSSNMRVMLVLKMCSVLWDVFSSFI
jgi:hypothetical protein